MNDNFLAVSRVLWIDVVRGIMIILMIFGHNIQFGSGADILDNQLFFDNLVFRFIYSFHIPCLMILSGYFFGFNINNLPPPKKMWKKRVQTVLIPTIAWSLIFIGLYFVRAIFKHQLDVETVLECLRYIVTYYWFLWAIMFGTLMVWFVHRYLKDSIIAYVVLGAGLLLVPKVLNTEIWIFMYPYFATGYLWNVKKMRIKWAEERKEITLGILIAVFIGLFIFFNTDSFIYTTGITVRSLTQLEIDLYRYAIGFIGSAMVIWIVYILYPIVVDKETWLNKRLAYCGQISLTVYTIDCLINSFVLPRLTKGFTLNYGIILVETVIVLLICIEIDWMIKKIPIARRVLLGNR